MTEADVLLLFDCIPLKSGLPAIQKIVPDLEHSQHGDWRIEIPFKGHTVKAEFNLMGGCLYGVYFHMPPLSRADGDALLDDLVAFYSERFGEVHVEAGDDTHGATLEYDWCTEDYAIGIHVRPSGDHRTIAWGYQAPCPHDIESVMRFRDAWTCK